MWENAGLHHALPYGSRLKLLGILRCLRHLVRERLELRWFVLSCVAVSVRPVVVMCALW